MGENRTRFIRGIICLGRNGAALAALGEIVVLPDFEAFLVPSPGDRNEGVKLGESTLKDFLDWLHSHVRLIFRTTRSFSYLSLTTPSDWADFSTL